jgi:hypothetical protein
MGGKREVEEERAGLTGRRHSLYDCPTCVALLHMFGARLYDVWRRSELELTSTDPRKSRAVFENAAGEECAVMDISRDDPSVTVRFRTAGHEFQGVYAVPEGREGHRALVEGFFRDCLEDFIRRLGPLPADSGE